ncbi:hypothetical protein ON010_g429 [Phytophthora cinnamomi]|nr:hypothetical protein ON010_g429 [Phytophthora cinnamomi]
MGTLCQSAELTELAGFSDALQPTDEDPRPPDTKDEWLHARGRHTYGDTSTESTRKRSAEFKTVYRPRTRLNRAAGRPDEAGHDQRLHKRTKREPGELSSTQPSRRDLPVELAGLSGQLIRLRQVRGVVARDLRNSGGALSGPPEDLRLSPPRGIKSGSKSEI